jgi:hypothetical protein
VDAMERGQLVRFWLEWSQIRDVNNLTYSEHEGVCDFCGERGSVRCRGVYNLVLDVGGVSRVVGWPSMNTDMFLINCRDFKFRIGNECVKGFVPLDKEPGVVDEF